MQHVVAVQFQDGSLHGKLPTALILLMENLIPSKIRGKSIVFDLRECSRTISDLLRDCKYSIDAGNAAEINWKRKVSHIS